MIKATPWDDAYFNLKSGRVNLTSKLTELEAKELKEESQQFDWVVIDNSQLENDKLLTSFQNVYLCDIQVKFKLDCQEAHSRQIENIEVKSHLDPVEEILNISQAAYRYSRFTRDPFLELKKSQEVYVKWCQGAFNQPDKYFLTYKDNGKVAGYILFHREAYLMVELIAVETKQQRTGIGNKMLEELIHYAKENKFKEIRLGTQADNRQAILFYQQKGFKVDEIHTIYHYWPHKYK